MTPIHFYHYSPSGLMTILRYTGFDVVELGQFGNAKYVDFLSQGVWPDYAQVMDASGRIDNDPNFPVQVWALARKL